VGSSDERRLREVVELLTTADGFDLEELTVVAAGRRRVVRVVIDRDGGVSLDDAATLSRRISDMLDAPDDPMGAAPYALEVTSPGIGRPLTLPRHFRRARTRRVSLTTADGRALSGHVLAATDSAVTLLTGKTGADQLTVPFDTILKARVEVEFGRPPAAVQELLGIQDEADTLSVEEAIDADDDPDHPDHPDHPADADVTDVTERGVNR